MAEKLPDQLLRQQYLVPRRSVLKLRQLGKKFRVPLTEIVRRAIDSYDPSVDAAALQAQEAAAQHLLAEVHAELRRALRRIDADLSALDVRQRALEDGSVRERVRRDTEQWLRRQAPELSLHELFAG